MMKSLLLAGTSLMIRIWFIVDWDSTSLVIGIRFETCRLRIFLVRATLIVARAHILSRPRAMCSQVRML